MIREDIRKRLVQEKVVKMAPKHQSVAVQRGASMKSHSYNDDERVTIITIPVTEEGQGEEEVYNAVMNVEEFLAEHNISVDDNYDESCQEYSEPVDVKPIKRPSIIVAPKRATQTSTSSGLYKESKRAIAEREKEEKRKRIAAETEFSPEDLSLATIPGLEFDPKERAFDMEELRPQPIIKKRSKLFVQDQEKDNTYWKKREKNNNAARRSREARRLKENQIALRVAHLERENGGLKQVLGSAQFDVTKLANERDLLKRKLSHYE